MIDYAAIIKSLSPSHRKVLDQIGAGNESPLTRESTIKSLCDKKLIERIADRIIGDQIPVYVKCYQMPVAVHMTWCEICSEELEGKE